MEATVRSIATETCRVEHQVIQTGNKPALCFQGETYALGVINDEESIHTVTLTLEEVEEAPLLTYDREEYPVGKFIAHMERIMEDKPISDEALELIRNWPNNPPDFGDEIIADPKPMSKSKLGKTVSQNCIMQIAAELNIPATKLRKILRSKGFSAPYDNAPKIREALTNKEPQ